MLGNITLWVPLEIKSRTSSRWGSEWSPQSICKGLKWKQPRQTISEINLRTINSSLLFIVTIKEWWIEPDEPLNSLNSMQPIQTLLGESQFHQDPQPTMFNFLILANLSSMKSWLSRETPGLAKTIFLLSNLNNKLTSTVLSAMGDS
jgi:hypothetical protein